MKEWQHGPSWTNMGGEGTDGLKSKEKDFKSDTQCN